MSVMSMTKPVSFSRVSSKVLHITFRNVSRFCSPWLLNKGPRPLSTKHVFQIFDLHLHIPGLHAYGPSLSAFNPKHRQIRSRLVRHAHRPISKKRTRRPSPSRKRRIHGRGQSLRRQPGADSDHKLQRLQIHCHLRSVERRGELHRELSAVGHGDHGRGHG